MTSLKDGKLDHVGVRIAAARKARGLNRNQLARRVKTSWALVAQWETGKTTPTIKSVRRIADVLGVSVYQLVWTDSPSSSPASDGFDEYLRLYLPEDLSDAELLWLRSTPTTNSPLSPDTYADILRALRTSRRGWERPTKDNGEPGHLHEAGCASMDGRR